MTVLKTAYETTACKDYLMKRTMDAVKVAWTHGQLPALAGAKYSIKEVQGGSAVVDDIPTFAHPLALMENDHDVSVIVDVRGFGKFDQTQHRFQVRSTGEYTLTGYRARLNYVWLTESPFILRDVSPMPMSVFSAWISENISRRFGLDPKEQFQVAILAAIWYNSQFTDNSEMNERERLALATAVSRSLRCRAQDVLEIADNVPYIANIQHFCGIAVDVTGSVRLKDLNPGLLYAIVGGTWFGSNAKEMLAVALEHPPTWMAVLLHAVTDRSVKNSPITKITERASYRNEIGNYIRALQHVTGALADK